MGDDLRPAERRLVEDGTLDLGRDDDPIGGADWPRERTVRAHVVRDMLLGDATTRLEVVGARIAGDFDFEGMTAVRAVVLDHCHFDGGFNVQDAQLISLRLSGCHLRRGLNARGCDVRGVLMLDRGFCAEEEVVLAQATVGGLLVCIRGRFLNPGEIAINADGLSIAGSVLMRDGFEAEGEVRLIGARIQGGLSCRGGRFQNPDGPALTCDRLTAGNVHLAGARVEGTVRLLNAEIHGDFNLNGAQLSQPQTHALLADKMTVHGSMFCGDGFRADGELRLRNAGIENQLSIRGVISSPGERVLNLEGAHITRYLFLQPTEQFDGVVNLSAAHVGSLLDGPFAWEGGYELRGCRYGHVRSTWERENRRRWLRSDTAVAHRLAWLRGNESGYQPQLYDQLSEVYGAAGEEEHQRDVLVAKQRRRREQLAWYRLPWHFAKDILIGFGYQTGRALIPFVAFLAFGWWYFGEAYDDGEVIERSSAPTVNEPPFSSFIYSLDQLVPVVNFGQRESWVATGEAQTLATIMVIVGWILTTAILAALTGLVRRNQ